MFDENAFIWAARHGESKRQRRLRAADIGYVRDGNGVLYHFEIIDSAFPFELLVALRGGEECEAAAAGEWKNFAVVEHLRYKYGMTLENFWVVR